MSKAAAGGGGEGLERERERKRQQQFCQPVKRKGIVRNQRELIQLHKNRRVAANIFVRVVLIRKQNIPMTSQYRRRSRFK